SHPSWNVHLVQETNVFLPIEKELEELNTDLVLMDVLDCVLQWLRSNKASSGSARLVIVEEEKAEACQLADAVVNVIYGGL
ncbi:spore coat protein, partial [Bacillus pumilus]